MTEGEWRRSTDPEAMLAFLLGRGSERKLRLFAVACSRRVWPGIDDLGRSAVEAAELYADGLLGAEELRAARLACRGAGERACWYAANSDAARAAGNAARSARHGAADPLAEGAAQADLLREIFGNPFQTVALSRSWLTPAVEELARAMYAQRDFSRMPELAAALEQAGCTASPVLAHCRAGPPHVRGCWVIDLLLGKA
jgi:hypothetical protein